MSTSLEVTDQASAAVATHARVSLKDIEGKIFYRLDLTGDQLPADVGHELDTLSICILVMFNGFMVIGKSAPASPQNFDRALGKQFAYEDAIRQLWPLEGYALREKLAG